jgi:ssDNA-binding Zn-finger/Zn-ribbon topoisomerase 1
MPDPIENLEEEKPVDGGAKPAPLPRAVRKPAVCDNCKEALRRFASADGKTGDFTYAAHRCPKCKTWLKQFTTFDKVTYQLAADPRLAKASPVIGEASLAKDEG